ncbi:MAG TPA: glutamine synthetase family protein [Polyangiaceae bacterium]|jgi:glutamine synthetase
MELVELRAAFERFGIRRVKVGGYDIDGVLRGKYVSIEKFWSAAEGNFGFCDVIFGWDIGDVLYDNGQVTGWHSGYPDAHARVDLSTFRTIPWEPGTAAFLVDFINADGSPHPACPRSMLKKVLARAAQAGFKATFAAEFEFFMFKETPQSLEQKGFRDLESLTPGMFGYSWVREGQNSELCHAILDEMEAFGIPIEGLHTETGPGVYEVAIRYDEALAMADKAALFKSGMKQLCARRGLLPTFMAKWNDKLPGSSGHLHQSLWSMDGKSNLFYDAAGPNKLSKLATHYLGGQIALMPSLTALFSPTVNSYKRYVPGVWAPLTASWGVENRTCAIRVIPADAKATRLEYRQTAADINPYIAIAAALGAGLWGIETAAVPPAESRGDASANADESDLRLPRTLREAVNRLSRCAEAPRVLDAAFVDHYVRTREWEARQYERAVTEWELRRYFEGV